MAAPRAIEERIYRAVMRIPHGKVATYGQVGRLAGMEAGGARLTCRVMAVPCPGN